MSDAIALARALRAAPESSRASLIQIIFAQAEEAADFAKEHGRTHPRYGNGSVMAASAGFPQINEPTLEDLIFCDCLRQVFEFILKR